MKLGLSLRGDLCGQWGGGVHGGGWLSPRGGAGCLTLHLCPMNPACSSWGGQRVCVPEHSLQIFFQICGTCSKAFLILLSFNSGTEKCVCKIVSPKFMLVASYKRGVWTEKKCQLCLSYPRMRAMGTDLECSGGEVYRQRHAYHMYQRSEAHNSIEDAKKK